MFCGKCGTNNPDTNKFCKSCGRALVRPQQPGAPVQNAPVPVVTSPGAPTRYYGPPQPVPVTAGRQPLVQHPPGKTMLVLGIGSTLVGFISLLRYPYICGILAIVLGVLVLYKSENKKSKAVILGIVGIVLGLASIILDLFFFSFFPPGSGVPL